METNLTVNTANVPVQPSAPGEAKEASGQPGVDEGSSVHASAGSYKINYNGYELSPSQAVNLMFLDQSQTFNKLAKDRVKEATEKMNEVRKARNMLGRMREQSVESGGHGHATEMPADMVQYCKENDIKTDRTAGDDRHTKTEWKLNVQYAQGHVDKLHSDTRVVMLKLKSIISALNSSLSGLSKAEDKDAHVTKQIVGS